MIQPEGVKRLGSPAEGTALNFADETMRSYSFLYRYDGQGRVIQSQAPGGGVSEFAYDERGRLVACSSPEMKRNGLWKVTGYDELDRVKEESYVKFQSGVSAESIRAEVSDGRDLPPHTTVRRTYSARYYGEREDDGMPFDAYPVGDNVIFDVTDRISPASQSRMVLGETGENVLVSSAEYLHMPGETEINDVTAVPKEDFVNDTSGLSMSSDGERRFKTILATGYVLMFTAYEMVSSADMDVNYLKGLLKEERISSVPEIDGTVISADTLTRVRRYYYDYRGNVVQVKELDSDGWAACYSTKYDFSGNVTGTLESHTSPGDWTSTVKTVRTLTPRGVLLSETVYADDVQVSHTDYTYDDLLRPVGKTTGCVTETMSYDIRGWQTGHTADTGGQDRIYSETLRYMAPSSGSSVARWTGLISESVAQHFGAPARSDSYAYDAAGRLTSSNLETGISYDSNGNVTSLRRLSAIVNLSASPAAGTQNAILEQNDYTPFGTRLTSALKTQTANRWRYAGKEEFEACLT